MAEAAIGPGDVAPDVGRIDPDYLTDGKPPTVTVTLTDQFTNRREYDVPIGDIMPRCRIRLMGGKVSGDAVRLKAEVEFILRPKDWKEP